MKKKKKKKFLFTHWSNRIRSFSIFNRFTFLFRRVWARFLSFFINNNNVLWFFSNICIFSLKSIKKFLCMRTNLCACSRFYMFFNFFPIFAKKRKSFNEKKMLFSCPATLFRCLLFIQGCLAWISTAALLVRIVLKLFKFLLTNFFNVIIIS